MNDPNQHDAKHENLALKSELAAMTRERDVFRNAYYQELEKTAVNFTEEELHNGIPSGPWLDELIERLEAGDPRAGDCIPLTRSAT